MEANGVFARRMRIAEVAILMALHNFGRCLLCAKVRRPLVEFERNQNYQPKRQIWITGETDGNDVTMCDQTKRRDGLVRF